MFNVTRIIYSFYGVKNSPHAFSPQLVSSQCGYLSFPTSHSSQPGWHLKNPRVSSAMGFGQSFPERRVEVCGIMFRCFNVHVQTCSSFITSKRCREDSLNLLMSFPTTTTKKKTATKESHLVYDSKVLLTCISDSYANETKIQPLKEKSTSSKSAC